MTRAHAALPTIAPAAERPITSLDALAARGLISADDITPLAPVIDRFQLRLTPEIARLVETEAADGLGPVGLQFIPSARELDIAPHELSDPIGDDVHSPVRGITHRYPDRVLLKPTHLCQVYCRFCFRREKVGDGEQTLSDTEIDAALGYIADRPQIFEVILTGGDPLVLSDRRLARILDGLAAIDHIGVVRFHTRVVTANPDRITPGFVSMLKRRYAVWVALHVNHASELTEAASAAIARLVDGGVPLISQTVLLKGVNDSVDALSDLMRALVRRRVKPYYLHHLDMAEGTGHFRTSIEEGRRLVDQLRGVLTGVAQPTYVLDIPGGFGKSPLEPGWIAQDAPGRYRVKDWRGDFHAYSDPAAGDS